MPCFNAVSVEIDDGDLDVKTLVGDHSARRPALMRVSARLFGNTPIETAPTTYPAPRQQILLMDLGREGVTEAMSRPIEGVGNQLLSLLFWPSIMRRMLNGV